MQDAAPHSPRQSARRCPSSTTPHAPPVRGHNAPPLLHEAPASERQGARVTRCSLLTAGHASHCAGLQPIKSHAALLPRPQPGATWARPGSPLSEWQSWARGKGTCLCQASGGSHLGPGCSLALGLPLLTPGLCWSGGLSHKVVPTATRQHLLVHRVQPGGPDGAEHLGAWERSRGTGSPQTCAVADRGGTATCLS